MPKRMHLAFDLSYIHMEGRWRMPGAWPGRYPDVAMFEEIARIAEHGLLDMLFSGDGTGVPSTWAKSRDAAVRWGVSWPRQDLSPMSVAMSRVTKHLGFGITYSTTFTHPYFLARHFNSLDHVTGGRIAFNVITSTRRSDYANYGYDDLVAHDERYDRMEEFIDVCRALWSSVEPDAMLWDEDTGQVGDPGKVHDVEHRGRFFKVSGPLNTPPSPQTRPVLLQAGSSPRGVRACAYVADMAFGPDMPLSLQIAQRKALDEAVAALGRDPEGMGIIWQQPCVVAETEHEAVTRRELLLSAIPVEGVGVYLSHNGGYDFSTLPQRFTLGELHREIIASQASPGGFMREMVTRFGADTESPAASSSIMVAASRQATRVPSPAHQRRSPTISKRSSRPLAAVGASCLAMSCRCLTISRRLSICSYPSCSGAAASGVSTKARLCAKTCSTTDGDRNRSRTDDAILSRDEIWLVNCTR
jgi:FMN-dependent oxidoreductase (nitrilotriacetate monooxygenase family)